MARYCREAKYGKPTHRLNVCASNSRCTDTIYNIAVCLRELALRERWNIVNKGGISSLTQLLREGVYGLIFSDMVCHRNVGVGTAEMKAAAAGSCAMLASEPDLAELLYSCGAGKVMTCECF